MSRGDSEGQTGLQGRQRHSHILSGREPEGIPDGIKHPWVGRGSEPVTPSAPLLYLLPTGRTFLAPPRGLGPSPTPSSYHPFPSTPV